MNSSLAIVAFGILEWNCSLRLNLWEAGCWRASGGVDEFVSTRMGSVTQIGILGAHIGGFEILARKGIIADRIMKTYPKHDKNL